LISEDPNKRALKAAAFIPGSKIIEINNLAAIGSAGQLLNLRRRRGAGKNPSDRQNLLISADYILRRAIEHSLRSSYFRLSKTECRDRSEDSSLSRNGHTFRDRVARLQPSPALESIDCAATRQHDRMIFLDRFQRKLEHLSSAVRSDVGVDKFEETFIAPNPARDLLVNFYQLRLLSESAFEIHCRAKEFPVLRPRSFWRHQRLIDFLRIRSASPLR
jgi:hypothetical protein